MSDNFKELLGEARKHPAYEQEGKELEASELAAPTGSGGRQTKEFVCQYYHDGGWWGLNIRAYDMADAEARCKKLGNLKLDGELVMTSGAGLLVRAMCWLRNLFH